MTRRPQGSDYLAGGQVEQREPVGLADQLREAVASYTASGGRGKMNINFDDAVAALREWHGVVRDMLHGFDVEAVIKGPATKRAAGVASGIDFVLQAPDLKSRYLQAVAELSKAFALAATHDDAMVLRDDVPSSSPCGPASSRGPKRRDGGARPRRWTPPSARSFRGR